MYKHGYDDIDLFVEKDTDRVPHDGAYHLVLRGQVIEQEANLKRALARLQQLRNNLPTDLELAEGGHLLAKQRASEMASRHLSQSTAEKTSQFARKGRKG